MVLSINRTCAILESQFSTAYGPDASFLTRDRLRAFFCNQKTMIFPWLFTPKTTIQSTKVNENFTAIDTVVNNQHNSDGTHKATWVDAVRDYIKGYIDTVATTFSNKTLSGETKMSSIHATTNSVTGITLQNSDGSSTQVVCDSVNNRVGIAGTIPSYTLHVGGDVASNTGYMSRDGISGSFQSNKFNHHWSGSAAYLFVDTSNLGQIAFVSDERVKKDIVDVHGSLEKILSLRPKKFRFIHTDDHIYYGLLAQDVIGVIPDIVHNTGMQTDETPDGMLRVDYNGLFAMLIDSIQDQQRQIDGLQAQVEELRNRS